MSSALNVGTAGVTQVVAAPPQTTAVDSKAAMAQTDVARFCGFVAQLGLLLAVFYLYDLEEQVFGILSLLIVSGFAIHYWLPFRWKETFYIGWSLVGAFILLPPAAAALLIVAGLGLYALATSPLPLAARFAAVAIACAVLAYGRATLGFGIPVEFWPVFGSIFMFRFLIYLYEVAHAKTKPGIRDFLTYFFVLPNYYFLLFPVVDYQTHRQTYFRRNINEIVQQGIAWIARGTIQLLLYRLVYHWKGPSNAPEAVTTFSTLMSTMILTYLLYLRVSGQFHIIVGFLHLFGYDLPETHRRYLLARSLTDFWRRINIYWKDFMVKVVYFPVYFRLRRGGETRAQIVATIIVFVTTWFLHAYQWFWLRGEFLMTWPDTLFWGILGALVTLNLLVERTRPRPKAQPAWRKRLEPVQVAGTFCLIVTLWSLWNSPSLPEWVDLITWWRVG
jgi:D-alanyl-lipoteichoic acid acyltransferase DltB (MBOAT superfamily)